MTTNPSNEVDLGASEWPQRGEQPSEGKSVTDTCLEVRETTAVRLKENIPPFPSGTMFVYRCERWYYPEYDVGVEKWDGEGASQLWYVGATNDEVPRWMYALLIRAAFYKGSGHILKELFELIAKEGVTDLLTEGIEPSTGHSEAQS